MQDKISTPIAIVVAGLLIAGAVYASNQTRPTTDAKKSIAEQIGSNGKKVQACVSAGTYKNKVQAQSESGSRAMAHLPEQERGTPYNVLINKAGVKVEMAGALPYEMFKQAIDEMLAGKAKNKSEINLDPITKDDHMLGNPDAEITIVEYTDMECPFCARIHPTLHQIVTDYGGKVNWVVRHFPLDNLHPNARTKAEASECVWAQDGDEAFFKYTDKLFEAAAPQKPAFDTTTL